MNLTSLTTTACLALADRHPDLVRREGRRRHDLASRKFLRLQRALDRARLETAEACMIMSAGAAQIDRLYRTEYLPDPVHEGDFIANDL
jgi:hypothetical protein